MNRQLMTILAVLGLAALSACGRCGGNPACTGEEGACCRESLFGANPCDTGLHCADGICESCGAPGEPCCLLNTCTGGNECRRVEGELVCGNCGEVGEACCPSDLGPSCTDGVRCDIPSDVCVDLAGPGCGGSTPQPFWGRLSNGCSSNLPEAPLVVTADDESIAENCARAVLGTSDVRTEPPEYHTFCEDPPFGVCLTQRRSAFSDSDALDCARATCGGGCTVVAGSCPSDGSCPGDP